MSAPRILNAPIVLLLALLAAVAGAIQLVAASDRPRTQAAAPARNRRWRQARWRGRGCSPMGSLAEAPDARR